MTSEPTSRHLTHHHRETLARLFAHPTSHNVGWREVRSLLEAVGEVDERHDDRIHVAIGEHSHQFSRPRHKEVSTELVMELRGFLRTAGYEPEAS